MRSRLMVYAHQQEIKIIKTGKNTHLVLLRRGAGGKVNNAIKISLQWHYNRFKRKAHQV